MNSTIDRQRELNEKIATLLGWEIDKTTSRLWGHEPNPGGGFREWKSVPDYCNDLNAMHEAERARPGGCKANKGTRKDIYNFIGNRPMFRNRTPTSRGFRENNGGKMNQTETDSLLVRAIEAERKLPVAQGDGKTDYSELMSLRTALADEQRECLIHRKRADKLENIIFNISNERPVQDKAAAAFYRVRQKAKLALKELQ